jgi:ankyrin repeat protein
VSFNYDVIFLDAAKTGQLATVTDMVETHKVPVEKRTATGMTAVCLAATNGHVNVLRYLLAKGGKVNFQCPDGCTPLHLAILEERVDTVDFLMKHGADKTAKTPEGETPMDWAEDCEAILDILSKY